MDLDLHCECWLSLELKVDDSKAGMTDKVIVLGHVPRINKRREEEVFPVCAHSKTVCGATRLLWIILQGGKISNLDGDYQ